MRKDIILEKEVERTIGKFNSIKRLPSAFSSTSPKRRLDTADKILIIAGILLFLFIFSRVIINKMESFVYDKLNETVNLQYVNGMISGSSYFLMDSSIILDKDIQIEEVEAG